MDMPAVIRASLSRVPSFFVFVAMPLLYTIIVPLSSFLFSCKNPNETGIKQESPGAVVTPGPVCHRLVACFFALALAISSALTAQEFCHAVT